MNMRTVLAAFSSVALALALNATTCTSASYVQSGLIAQWDGIDNQGTGTHDPNATTWKDLKGSLDMTLTAKGWWNSHGNALFVNGWPTTTRSTGCASAWHRDRSHGTTGRAMF